MKPEDILDLMYRPIYNEKMLKAMEELEMEIPQLDEKYELELIVGTSSNNSGIDFEFKEIDGYSLNGEPVLKIISWTNQKIPYPINLTTNDNYEICCQRFGKKADFIDEWDDAIKTWLIEYNNNKIHVNIHYANDDLNSISCIVLTTYDESEIGGIYIPNEE